MIKTRLNLRLKANYEQKIRKYLQQLKKDGYIISNDHTSENKYIVRYSVEKQDFLQVCYIHDFFEEKIDRQITNPFDIRLSYSEIIDMILEVLPIVKYEDLECFRLYEKYEVEYTPFDELDDELNDFVKLSKTLTKEIDMANFTNPNTQSQILNSELVFYTGDSAIGNISDKRSYFKYDKKSKTFKKLTAIDIHELLIKKFKINSNSLDVSDIKKNMRTIYNELINTSTLPIRWNHNQDSKNKLKEFSKSYKKVKKVTDVFE